MKGELYKQNTGYPVTSRSDEEPGFYQIVLHHDAVTPRDFVMGILEKLFFLDRRQAAEVMLDAQKQGRAACGLFSKDVAESKIEQVLDLAREHEYPLVCSMEAA